MLFGAEAALGPELVRRVIVTGIISHILYFRDWIYCSMFWSWLHCLPWLFVFEAIALISCLPCNRCHPFFFIQILLFHANNDFTGLGMIHSSWQATEALPWSHDSHSKNVKLKSASRISEPKHNYITRDHAWLPIKVPMRNFGDLQNLLPLLQVFLRIDCIEA